MYKYKASYSISPHQGTTPTPTHKVKKKEGQSAVRTLEYRRIQMSFRFSSYPGGVANFLFMDGF